MGVELKGSSPEVWTIQYTVPASAASGTALNGSITRVIGQPAINIATVPNTEMWEIDDFYTQASQTPDGNIQPVRNGTIQPFQPDLNSLIISNQNKIKLPAPLVLKPGDQFYMNAVLNQANGTTAVTLTVYAVVIRHSLE